MNKDGISICEFFFDMLSISSKLTLTIVQQRSAFTQSNSAWVLFISPASSTKSVQHLTSCKFTVSEVHCRRLCTNWAMPFELPSCQSRDSSIRGISRPCECRCTWNRLIKCRKYVYSFILFQRWSTEDVTAISRCYDNCTILWQTEFIHHDDM